MQSWDQSITLQEKFTQEIEFVSPCSTYLQSSFEADIIYVGMGAESADIVIDAGLYTIGDRKKALWTACCGGEPTFTITGSNLGSPSVVEQPLAIVTAREDLTDAKLYPLVLTFDASEITEG